jgi:hypothetical protein
VLVASKVGINFFNFIVMVSIGFSLVLSHQAWTKEVFVDGASPPPQLFNKSQATHKLKGDYSRLSIPFDIVLPPMAAAEKSAAATPDKNQRLKVGVGRNIPATFAGDLTPYLAWTESTDGSLTAALSITSPEAHAMRLALAVQRLPKGVEIRFFNPQQPNRMFGPFSAEDISPAVYKKQSFGHKENSILEKTSQERDLFWSPVIEGDTIALEVYLPSSKQLASFAVSIPQISHLTLSVLDLQTKSLSDMGLSGSCNIDVSCSDANPTIRAATAKIVFTDNGTTYMCSGTLLNDREKGWIPYFMTANHCLNTVAAARTVNSYWLFERASCGGGRPSSVIQFARGAELLASGANSDFAFLQLKDADIAQTSGIKFAGWNAGTLQASSDVVGIHHPSGDLKKWSHGTAMGLAEYGDEVNGSGSHIQVVWSEGTTEGGSSGSALFDNKNRFRGNLHGGYASCYDANAPDWYGRFDITYPKVKRWLKKVAKSLPSGKTISKHVKSGKWKDYKIEVAPNKRLSVRLYNLSEDADLYVRMGSRPNETNGIDGFDCRPYLGGTQAEICTLDNNTAKTVTYFISVHGYKAANYKLKVTRS